MNTNKFAATFTKNIFAGNIVIPTYYQSTEILNATDYGGFKKGVFCIYFFGTINYKSLNTAKTYQAKFIIKIKFDTSPVSFEYIVESNNLLN